MTKVYEMIAKESWVSILELDELNREIKANRVLGGFKALEVYEWW
jgi:hypothetical protein